MVVLDKPTYDRILKEVPTYKMISQSVLIDRMKINGSLARVAIQHLVREGQIKKVIHHHGQLVYSECHKWARAIVRGHALEAASSMMFKKYHVLTPHPCFFLLSRHSPSRLCQRLSSPYRPGLASSLV